MTTLNTTPINLKPSMNLANDTKSLLIRVIAAFTKHTDDIRVETSDGGSEILHTVQVHQEDYHKVVGKGGHRITALTALFRLIGKAHGHTVSVVLVRMPRSDHIEPEAAVRNDRWNSTPTATLIRDLTEAGKLGCTLECKTTAASTTFLMKAIAGHNDMANWFANLTVILIAIGRKEGRILYLDTAPE